MSNKPTSSNITLQLLERVRILEEKVAALEAKEVPVQPTEEPTT